jgi:hypothetical protein
VLQVSCSFAEVLARDTATASQSLGRSHRPKAGARSAVAMLEGIPEQHRVTLGADRGEIHEKQQSLHGV